MKSRWIALIAVWCLACRATQPLKSPQVRLAVPTVPSGEIRQWREDITFLMDGLVRGHAAPFHTTSQSALQAEVETLVGQLPQRTRSEILVELSRIVALVGDGHSRFRTYPSSENRGLLGFRIAPIRFEAVGGEFVVSAAPNGLAELAGARLVQVAKLRTADVQRRLAPLVSRDNAFGLDPVVALYLPVTDVLAVRGIAEGSDSVLYHFERPDGSRVERWLHAAVADSLPVSDAFSLAGKVAPRHLRARHEYYWHDWIAERSAAYLQINAIADKSGSTLGEYCVAVIHEAERRGLDRLIVDLRYNGGGSRELALPCIDALRTNIHFNRPGHLFLLIGARTFSAALWTALDVDRTTAATVIGEPTGGRPNFYGETRRVESPNFKLRATFASRMNIRTDSTDNRVALEPDVVVRPHWTDFIRGRDPVLDRALSWSRRD